MRKLSRKARVALTAVWAGMLTLGLVGVPGTTETALATGTTTVTYTTTAYKTVTDYKTVTVYKTVTETVTTTVKDIKTVTATVTTTLTKILTTTQAQCNSGRGNGSETTPANDCDPGNSGGHNQGGD